MVKSDDLSCIRITIFKNNYQNKRKTKKGLYCKENDIESYFIKLTNIYRKSIINNNITSSLSPFRSISLLYNQFHSIHFISLIYNTQSIDLQLIPQYTHLHKSASLHTLNISIHLISFFLYNIHHQKNTIH